MSGKDIGPDNDWMNTARVLRRWKAPMEGGIGQRIMEKALA